LKLSSDQVPSAGNQSLVIKCQVIHPLPSAENLRIDQTSGKWKDRKTFKQNSKSKEQCCFAQNKLTNIHIVAWHSVHHLFFPLQSFDGHLNYKCKQPQDNFLASETHQETSGH